MFQKLYRVVKDGKEAFVLAYSFEGALLMWRQSSVAYAKADPDSLALAIPDMIGAAKQNRAVTVAPETPEAERQAGCVTLAGVGITPRTEEEKKHRHSSI